MYNGKIINDLLAEKGVKKNELLKHLGYSCYTQLRQVVDGNPSVSVIEKVADYFAVPVDAFFDREVPVTASTSSMEFAKNKDLKYQLEIEKQRVEALQRLMEEKESKIAILEDMVSLLKSQQQIK